MGAGGERLQEFTALHRVILCCSDLNKTSSSASPTGGWRKMKMKVFCSLFCMLTMCGAQKWKQETSPWDRKAKHASDKTCSNLTQVLDNWKFAIVTQVKELLINDHASVLPEYNRIQPLSVALGELYQQFSSVKDELVRLTARFDGMEAFMDDLKDGGSPVASRPAYRMSPSYGERSPLGAQRRKLQQPTLIRARRRGAPRPSS